jgi:putative NADPH-quinone reductase
MKVIAVRAHPMHDSYNAALFDVTLRALRTGGHSVTPFDLYDDDFDPRLGAQERREYHDPGRPLPPDIVRYVDALRSHDALVFVYPTWCMGLPAILKGWLDRVLRPGVAFSIDGTKVTPLLGNIRRVGAVTTYGRPRWMVLYVGDPPRKTVCRYVRWFCSRNVRLSYLAHYHMNASTEQSRARFTGRVEYTLSRWT